MVTVPRVTVRIRVGTHFRARARDRDNGYFRLPSFPSPAFSSPVGQGYTTSLRPMAEIRKLEAHRAESGWGFGEGQ